jgi:two-component system phosphate regulon response regulator PhoB
VKTVVLVVEDSPEVVALVERALAGEVRLRVARSLAEARATIRAERLDLILLDISLPDGEGFELCGELRSTPETKDVPVVFLTGRGGIVDKLAAFSLGADDYIVKPFDPLELLVRVRTRLERSRHRDRSDEVLRVGDLEINVASMKVGLVQGGAARPILLTSVQFRLLYHLASHERQVFDRAQLIRAVWNGAVVCERTVDTHLSNLRRKLGPLADYLESVRGVGYRFCSGEGSRKVES